MTRLRNDAHFAAASATHTILRNGADDDKFNIGKAPKGFTDVEAIEFVGTTAVRILESQNPDPGIIFDRDASIQRTEEFEKLVLDQKAAPVEQGLRVVFARAVVLG